MILQRDKLSDFFIHVFVKRIADSMRRQDKGALAVEDQESGFGRNVVPVLIIVKFEVSPA